MKKFILLLGACAALTGCHPSADVNRKMDERFDKQVGPSLDPSVATAAFYKTAEPQNYWYGPAIPLSVIAADRFRFGRKQLAKLDSMVASIKTDDHDISAAIGMVRDMTDVMQKALENSPNAQQNVLNEHAESGVKMPELVAIPFEKLVDEIDKCHGRLISDIRTVELNAIGDQRLSMDDLNLVRVHLKQLVVEGVTKRYKDGDKDVLDMEVNGIWKLYEENFPVGSTTRSLSNTQ